MNTSYHETFSESLPVDENTPVDGSSRLEAKENTLKTTENAGNCKSETIIYTPEQRQQFIQDTAKRITNDILTNAVWWYSSEWASVLQKFRMHKKQVCKGKKKIVFPKTAAKELPMEHCWYCNKDIRLNKMPVHIESCAESYYKNHPEEIEEEDDDMF
uniref:BED-type domain-containing protein n=1 Tax=Panagrellus redivivus TaxID=6233 RepID=A0A7E4W0U5_PANRE